MTVRIMMVELRRSTALIAAAAVVVLGVVVLCATSAAWTARWVGLTLQLRLCLVALWPLTLAAGAWHGGREHRHGTSELVAVTPRPARQRQLPAAVVMALVLVLAYAVLMVGGGIQVALTATYRGGHWSLVAAVGALSLLSAAWLGSAAGRLMPSKATPPALLVGGFALLVLLPILANGSTSGVDLLSPATESASSFVMVTSRVTAGQTIWLAGLAISGLVLLCASAVWARAAAVLPAVVSLVVALPLLHGGRASAFVVDPGATALVCTDSGPRVCVTRVHAAALPGLVGPAREALAVLSQLPDPPTAVVEDHTVRRVYVQPARADTVSIYLTGIDSDGRLSTPAGELRDKTVDGGGVRPCDNAPGGPAHTDAARAAVTGWLLHQQPSPGADPIAQQEWSRYGPAALHAWQTLNQLPPDVQRARLAAYRDAAIRCDRDPLIALTATAEAK